MNFIAKKEVYIGLAVILIIIIPAIGYLIIKNRKQEPPTIDEKTNDRITSNPPTNAIKTEVTQPEIINKENEIAIERNKMLATNIKIHRVPTPFGMSIPYSKNSGNGVDINYYQNLRSCVMIGNDANVESSRKNEVWSEIEESSNGHDISVIHEKLIDELKSLISVTNGENDELNEKSANGEYIDSCQEITNDIYNLQNSNITKNWKVEKNSSFDNASDLNVKTDSFNEKQFQKDKNVKTSKIYKKLLNKNINVELLSKFKTNTNNNENDDKKRMKDKLENVDHSKLANQTNNKIMDGDKIYESNTIRNANDTNPETSNPLNENNAHPLNINNEYYKEDCDLNNNNTSNTVIDEKLVNEHDKDISQDTKHNETDINQSNPETNKSADDTDTSEKEDNNTVPISIHNFDTVINYEELAKEKPTKESTLFENIKYYTKTTLFNLGGLVVFGNTDHMIF